MTGRQLMVRSLLTVVLPFMLPYAFISKLCVEIMQAFKYAWQEVRIEFASYLELMRKEM